MNDFEKHMNNYEIATVILWLRSASLLKVLRNWWKVRWWVNEPVVRARNEYQKARLKGGSHG